MVELVGLVKNHSIVHVDLVLPEKCVKVCMLWIMAFPTISLVYRYRYIVTHRILYEKWNINSFQNGHFSTRISNFLRVCPPRYILHKIYIYSVKISIKSTGWIHKYSHYYLFLFHIFFFRISLIYDFNISIPHFEFYIYVFIFAHLSLHRICVCCVVCDIFADNDTLFISIPKRSGVNKKNFFVI